MSTTLDKGKDKPMDAHRVPRGGRGATARDARAQTNWVFLNTHRLPFSNSHARRAVAYALNRGQMVANEGGTQVWVQ